MKRMYFAPRQIVLHSIDDGRREKKREEKMEERKEIGERRLMMFKILNSREGIA